MWPIPEKPDPQITPSHSPHSGLRIPTISLSRLWKRKKREPEHTSHYPRPIRYGDTYSVYKLPDGSQGVATDSGTLDINNGRFYGEGTKYNIGQGPIIKLLDVRNAESVQKCKIVYAPHHCLERALVSVVFR